jgi:hypothetical protein
MPPPCDPPDTAGNLNGIVRSHLTNYAPALAKTEDGEKSFVNTPLLLWANVTHEFAKSPCVDCPDLFDQHSGCLAEQIYFRAKRGSSGTGGCGRDEHHRSWQELVGLDDNPVTATVLLMTSATGRAELVDVTPEHACSP